MGRPERRETIRDVRALGALAHPARVALLNHLLAFGPATATQCSQVVAESPSACSYHLRELARWGFVERAEGGDGRARPWQAAATSFAFGEPGAAATLAAQVSLLALQLDSDRALAQEFMHRAGDLPAHWRDASNFSRYSLAATPQELAELVQRIDELVRPFIGLTRDNPPAAARAVHLSLYAFLNPGTAP
jgi:hypothetical protein